MGMPSVAIGTEREMGVGIAAGIAFHKVKVKKSELVPVEELDEEGLRELEEELKKLMEKLDSLETPDLLRKFLQSVLDAGVGFLMYKSAHSGAMRVVGHAVRVGEAGDVVTLFRLLREKYQSLVKNRRGMLFKYHPDKAPAHLKEEYMEKFKMYQTALDLYTSKLEVPFGEAVRSNSNQINLNIYALTDYEKKVLKTYYNMDFVAITAGGDAPARDRYWNAVKDAVNKAIRLNAALGGDIGKLDGMLSRIAAAAAVPIVTDINRNIIYGDVNFGEAGLVGHLVQDMQDWSVQTYGDIFNEEAELLDEIAHCNAEISEKKSQRKEGTAPKELKVSKRCAKPIVELEGFREYQRGKFVAGAKVTLGTTFGKVKYCNDAYVAMAPMLGVKVGQRLVLYGLGGFMFQRLVSPLVGVGIKFNLSDRFYARLEGNRWSNKKVRANVIKLGFGWRL